MKKASVLDKADLKILLLNLKGKKHSERNSTIIQLSYYLGLRSKELATMTIGSVLDKEMLNLSKEQTKGKKSRQIPLSNPKVKKIISEYLQFYKATYKNIDFQNDQPLFRSQKGYAFTPNTLQKLIKKIYDENGFKGKGYSSHSGRRSFITHLVNEGYSINKVQQVAGHTNIQTTIGYVQTNPDDLAKLMKMF